MFLRVAKQPLTRFAFAACLWGLGASAAQAATYTLSQLIAAGQTGIIVGDKQFYGFSYSGQPAQPPDITVVTSTTPNVGLRFEYNWNSTGGAKTDSIINYFVHTLDSTPQALITGVGLDFNGTTTGATDPTTNATVNETISDANQTPIGQAQVIDFGPGNAGDVDSNTFTLPTPQRTLFVRKDIQANSSTTSGTSTIGFVDNTFIQNVPEPASLMLLAAAGLPIVLRRRASVR